MASIREYLLIGYTSEHNNSARVINHDAAVFRHCPLFPLRCFETNDVPDGFPATLDELNDLQGAELDHLLNAFHLRQPQSNEEKKDALKLFFGCRPASYPA